MSQVRLQQCLGLTDAQAFARSLAAALRALPRGTLPLDAGCDQGGRVDDSDISVSLLDNAEGPERITARVGVFFTEIVGGCNCGDDPLEVNAYCILEVTIDRSSGVATICAAAA